MKKDSAESSMVTHTYNPRPQEDKAGGWQVWIQPKLYSKTLSQDKKKNKKKECWLQITPQSHNNKDSMLPVQKQTWRPMA
jgi:hypothetical protein